MTHTTLFLRQRIAGGVVIAVMTLSAALPAPAQTAPKVKSHTTAPRSTTVYVSPHSKTYYTPAQAKAMHYKDSMGHSLIKVSKIPLGYTPGSKVMNRNTMDKGSVIGNGRFKGKVIDKGSVIKANPAIDKGMIIRSSPKR